MNIIVANELGMNIRNLCQTFFYSKNKMFKGLLVSLFLFLGTVAQGQTISIGPDVAINEGNSGTTIFSFTVTYNGSFLNAPSAKYTVSGTGANPADASDFVGGAFPTGEVSFPIFINSTTITINVSGDLLIEPDETFIVTLSDPTNGYFLGNASAIGTIINDDACTAGTTAPALVTTVPTSFCDVINQNLNDYTNTPIPDNSVLTWSTNSDPLVDADHLMGSIATVEGDYYGFFYDTLNNCASPTSTVSLTLNATPTITDTTPDSRCGPGEVTLGAIASSGTATLNWYAAATGGTSLGTGVSFNPTITATTPL